jgi:hypothetical protein
LRFERITADGERVRCRASVIQTIFFCVTTSKTWIIHPSIGERQNMSSNNRERIDILLQNCRVVASIKQHEKLSTASEEYGIDAPSVISGLSRHWRGEARDINLDRVGQMTRELYGLITVALTREEHQHHSESSERPRERSDKLAMQQNTQFLDGAIQSMEDMLVGLEHLSETYHDDSRARAKVTTIRTNIKQYLEGIDSARQPIPTSSSSTATSVPIQIQNS